MKYFRASIVKEGSSGKYFGYITDIPSVCAQRDSVKELETALNENLKVFFRYLQEAEFKSDVEESDIEVV